MINYIFKTFLSKNRFLILLVLYFFLICHTTYNFLLSTNQFVYFTDKKKYTPYNYEYHSIPVENCQLVLFPGWLRHGNDNVINKMDERIVISFNSSSR